MVLTMVFPGGQQLVKASFNQYSKKEAYIFAETLLCNLKLQLNAIQKGNIPVHHGLAGIVGKEDF